MKTTLVIMAAGMGSRFSQSELKQLTPVGMNQEIIMDYSIYDALEAGFDSIVFIIRKEIEKAFDQAIGQRIKKVADVTYVYQELDQLPEGYEPIPGRKKPLGTGHAIYMCKNVIQNPFVIINADDYYGKQAFKLLHDYLVLNEEDYCMAGFILKNTLSKNGSVSRGICKSKDGYLLQVVENKKISEQAGKIISLDEMGNKHLLDPNTYASMNMWGVRPSLFQVIEEQLKIFLDHLEDPLKDEFLLPSIIDGMIQQQIVNVKVLETTDTWFGVTYQEDKEMVRESFRKLVENGSYPSPLF